MASKHLVVDSVSKSFYSHGNSLDTGGKSGVIHHGKEKNSVIVGVNPGDPGQRQSL